MADARYAVARGKNERAPLHRHRMRRWTGLLHERVQNNKSFSGVPPPARGTTFVAKCTRSLAVSISIAFVALGEKPQLSADAIQRDLKATWPSLPSLGKAEKKDITLAFSVGEASVILGLMPAPIPWSDLQGPCATSWLWPEAAS